MVRWRCTALALSLAVLVATSSLVARSEILIAGRDTTAAPGERIGVPVDIRITQMLRQSLTIQLQVRTRASVLLPEGAYRWVGSRDVLRYVTIRLAPGPARTERVQIMYTCVLGDSSQIGVRIVGTRILASDQSDDSTVQVARSGRLIVRDVCSVQGRPRLFSPWISRAQAPGTRTPHGGVWDFHGRYLGASLAEVCSKRGVEFLDVLATTDGVMVVR